LNGDLLEGEDSLVVANLKVLPEPLQTSPLLPLDLVWRIRHAFLQPFGKGLGSLSYALLFGATEY
jgi:hypothetical protein